MGNEFLLISLIMFCIFFGPVVIEYIILSLSFFKGILNILIDIFKYWVLGPWCCFVQKVGIKHNEKINKYAKKYRRNFL